ncbi:MAG: hypothetical protein LBJ99_01470 [Oscillospiraceae bacterium]|jgi:hypothetical protein|nr:hypothetical protein [Oscillospiraceae bacterium]
MSGDPDAQLPSVLRDTVNGEAKYCRIPVRRRQMEILAQQANDERRGIYPLSIEAVTDLILEELAKRGMVVDYEGEPPCGAEEVPG